MSTGEERRIYELRLAIEQQMYELVEQGFAIDDLRDFLDGVIDDIESAEEEEESD